MSPRSMTGGFFFPLNSWQLGAESDSVGVRLHISEVPHGR